MGCVIVLATQNGCQVISLCQAHQLAISVNFEQAWRGAYWVRYCTGHTE